MGEPILITKQTGKKYRDFVEVSHDLIWSVDADGCWTFVNQAVRWIYGYEPEEMLGRPFTDFEDPEQAKKDLVAFEEVKAGVPYFRYETKHIRKDGSPVYLLFNAMVIRDAQGKVLGTTGTAIDVTQRRLTQLELEKSLSLLRSTLEATADGILVVDNDGKIVSYNQKFLTMWGVPDSMMETKDNQKVIQFVLGQIHEPESFINKIKELYADPIVECFDTIRFKDGKIFERFSKPQMIGDQFVGRVWSFRDVTFQKYMEEALRIEREEQKVIFHSVPAMIWYKDRNNRILRCNHAAAKVQDLMLKKIQDHKQERLFSGEPSPSRQDDLEVIESKLPKLGVIEHMIMPNGEDRWIRTDKVPYFDEKGRVIGVIVFSIDITDQKSTERNLIKANRELQHLNQMKSQFASMVSHELRTPLTVIKEAISIVLDEIDGPVTPAQRDTLSLARGSVDRLSRLINNVLNYEKLESGKMEMTFESVNLNHLIREVVFFMEVAARKKDIQILVDLPDQAINWICDSDKIKEVLINLVDNSLKHTLSEGKIHVRLRCVDENIEIEVEDTGIGIRKEDQLKIFEMFRQGRSWGGVNLGGSGVGLAVCKLIVDQHSGQISVESVLGKGTKFLVRIPDLST